METIKKLLKGYIHYHEHKNDANLQELVQGQEPKTMIIACSDSRVDPAVLLHSDLGELFMVRNVANIVPPYQNDHHCHGTSAGIEFAVLHLKVKHIIIMGHSQCGGITAMKHGCDGSDFIESWVNAAKPTGELPDSIDDCARAMLHQSYQNCLTFPWIKSSVDDETLVIHRWFFDLSEGNITWYNQKDDAFVPLSEEILQSLT